VPKGCYRAGYYIGLGWAPNEEGSSSFLKKRTKKLLFLRRAIAVSTSLKIKSFLLLFFKKEALSFFYMPSARL
jgi:hypothetical protein